MAGLRGLGRHGRTSTGPKTAEGKAKCAKNSTRHGLSAYRADLAHVRLVADAIDQHFGASDSELGLVYALAEAEIRLEFVQRVVFSSLAGTAEPRVRLSARLAERYTSEAQAQRSNALSALVAARRDETKS